MKPPRTLFSCFSGRRAVFAHAGLGLLLSPGALTAKDKPAASAASTNTPAVALTIPQSVFATNSAVGRNPFFPQSASNPKTAGAAPVSRFPEGVRLGGISGFPARPLAIINGKTIAPGETDEVKIDGRRVVVRVVSVKETSAVITINGITEERFLRKEL